MNDAHWLDVLSRIVPAEAVDLDPILTSFDQAPGPAPVAERGRRDGVPVSSKLWARDETRSHIGIRVTEAPADVARLALRLASAAEERGVVPIILSALPTTGFEQFGFRVERLPDGPEELRAEYETELQRFWDMPIVIDLRDVVSLG